MHRRITFILISGVIILGLNGIAFAQTKIQTQTEVETVTQVTPEEAINVGNKICPVSGEKIEEDMEPVTYEYEGKIYNFCCPMCIDEFKKDPEKYIQKVEEELQAESREESKHEEHEKRMMQESEMSHQGMQGGHHH
jgi:YHS domain-containing protein